MSVVVTFILNYNFGSIIVRVDHSSLIRFFARLSGVRPSRMDHRLNHALLSFLVVLEQLEKVLLFSLNALQQVD